MPAITKTGQAFAATLARYDAFNMRDISDATIAYISLLVRHARSYQRIQEEACNGPWQASSATLPIEVVQRAIDNHANWCERREASLEAHMKLAARYIPGVEAVRFGGDPRRATVKLLLKSGRGDSWETVGDDINTDKPDHRRYVCVPC